MYLLLNKNAILQAKLTAEIEELYPDMDVDAHMGGQPIYYYVLAVE